MEIRPIDKLDYVMLMQSREFWQNEEDKTGVDLPLCAYVKTGAVSVRGGLILSENGTYLSMREVINYYNALSETVNTYFIAPMERNRGFLNEMREVLKDYPGMVLGFWIKPEMLCEKLSTHRLLACLSISLPERRENGMIYPAKIGAIGVHVHEFSDNANFQDEVIDIFDAIVVRIRMRRSTRKLS